MRATRRVGMTLVAVTLLGACIVNRNGEDGGTPTGPATTTTSTSTTTGVGGGNTVTTTSTSTGGQGGEVPPDWYDGAWSHRVALTFDHLGEASIDLADFVVPLRLDPQWGLDGVASPSADDLLLVDKQGNVVPLEVEAYRTGDGLVWLRRDIRAANPTETFHLYFGNPACASANCGLASPSEVYSVAFKAVWHLAETAGPLRDSTGRGADATGGDRVLTAGVTVGAQEVTDVRPAVVSPSLALGSGALTFSFWLRAFESEDVHVILSRQAGDEGWEPGGKQVLMFDGRIAYDVFNVGLFISAPLVDDQVWHHVGVIQDPSSNRVRFVIDGASATMNSPNPFSNDALGHRVQLFGTSTQGNSFNQRLDGSVDEIRLSSVIRPSEWLHLERLTQQKPDDFWAAGMVESIFNP